MPRPPEARLLRTLVLLAGLLGALPIASCGTLLGEKEEPEPAFPVLEGAALKNVFEVAETALAEENYEVARNNFGRILVSAPKNARARLGLAEVHLATGRVDQAITTFKALEEERSVRARARQGRGIGLLLKGEVEEATRTLKRAVANDPSLWRAWNGLGQAYDIQHHWDKAEQSYAKALAANPGSAIVLNNMGASLLMQKEYPRAAGSFSKALKIQPDFDQAESNLRLALAWQGKYAEALAGASRRKLPSVLNNIGYVAILRGDYERAEALLSQAMEASPSFNEKAWENIRYLESVRSIQKSQAEKGDGAR